MPDYKFIEKITVLQHPETKNIVRLMIEHDGNRNYGFQRSIVSNGTTRHFYNKKIWHSVYHIKDELECRVSEYEEKGFDVVSEISLSPNKIPAEPIHFDFTDEPLLVEGNVLPISANDIPLQIECSFNKLAITDLRYSAQSFDTKLVDFFDNVRKTIDFLPFDMVAVLSQNTLKVLSLEFKSTPQPKHSFNYLLLLSKKHTEYSIIDAATLLVSANAGMSFAYFTDNQLQFCIDQTWATANVFIEKSPHSPECKVYCIRDERFHQVFSGTIANVPRSGNAKVMYSNVKGLFSDFIFLSSLNFESELTTI